MTDRSVTQAEFNQTNAGAVVLRQSMPPLLRKGVAVGLVAAAGASLVMSILPNPWYGVSALMLALGATLVLITRRRAWIQDAIRVSPIRQGRFRLEWDAVGIRSIGEGQETMWRWSHIDQVLSAQGALIVVSGKLDYMVVPASVFESEADRAATQAEFLDYIAAARGR